eukprot:scaffold284914_cov32-Tisochrysis_lutea.AAC.6
MTVYIPLSAQHVSAGFQLHSCSPLDCTTEAVIANETRAVASSLSETNGASILKLDVSNGGSTPFPHQTSPPPTRTLPGAPRPPPPSSPPLLVVAATLRTSQGEHGSRNPESTQLVMLRASWQLQASRSPHPIGSHDAHPGRTLFHALEIGLRADLQS